MSELRKRIDACLAHEERQETLILELPRGSYVPVFSYRPAAPQEENGIITLPSLAPLEMHQVNLPTVPFVPCKALLKVIRTGGAERADYKIVVSSIVPQPIAAKETAQSPAIALRSAPYSHFSARAKHMIFPTASGL